MTNSSYRFVRIMLRNERGEYLCLKDLNGQWNLPGGKLEPGETIVEAARRELFEETGIKMDCGVMLHSGSFDYSGLMWDGYIVSATSFAGEARICEQDKFVDIGFRLIPAIAAEQTLEYGVALKTAHSLAD